MEKLRIGIGRTYDIPTQLVGASVSSRVAGRDYLGLGLSAEVTATNKIRKTVDFVASTSGKDRNGDEIRQDGWILKNFRKNPVHLWAHDSRGLPIGKAIKTVMEKDRLIQRIQYVPVAGFDLPQVVFELVEAGTLRGISVGFLPLEFDFMENGGGRIFIRQELLETSTVPIPSNADALVANNIVFYAQTFGLPGSPEIVLEVPWLEGDRIPAPDHGSDDVLEELIRIIQETETE